MGTFPDVTGQGYLTPIEPLPAFRPDDDERARQSHEWRRGWTAGWQAARREENLPATPLHPPPRNERALTWALAYAAEALSTQPMQGMPPLRPSGLVAACPDPPPALQGHWLLGWEYAHAAGLSELASALMAAGADLNSAETIDDHLGPMPLQPEQDGVDVRPRVRYAAFAAQAWWTVDGYYRRDRGRSDRRETDPTAPPYLAERAKVLDDAAAGEHAIRIGDAVELIESARRNTAWRPDQGVRQLPPAYLERLESIAVVWADNG